ncbi:MAG: hypothetical protein A2675_04130 [Candidatus Yonathbacteria bacterium RIFCSPHIGHO2_01_FULL_51_10]|uniref:DUF5673 domain-containing protein n=1 Tax=Candidatus Yonathbacteria bacterium RIFCSPHIGHO2_01_FULL_51_10 TaxID=1802723 RepID=A0A1G2S515_9BACT|nr:MAG: hypothetical protein A2675_04130 [Candidatus Yonathbacteria bacterium RIFCSPHIGHO2_01_FULL_51_10]
MESDMLISWEVPAYEHRPKTSDWYWALGIIAVSGSVAAFFLGNFLFGVLILVGAFTMGLHGGKEPPQMHVEIGERGIRIDKVLYPYMSLRSFWITPNDPPKLIILSKKIFVPHIIVPMEDAIDPLLVHEKLVPFLDEEEQQEPLPYRLMDWLGF